MAAYPYTTGGNNDAWVSWQPYAIMFGGLVAAILQLQFINIGSIRTLTLTLTLTLNLNIQRRLTRNREYSTLAQPFTLNPNPSPNPNPHTIGLECCDCVIYLPMYNTFLVTFGILNGKKGKGWKLG